MSDTALVRRQESGLTVFLSLVSGRLRPGKLWSTRRYRVKYLFRSLIYPSVTWKLVDAMASNAIMRDILPVQSTLPAKAHRPYLYGGMATAARAQAIIDHYQFVRSLTTPRLRQAMLTVAGTTLAQFRGKNDEDVAITLACTGTCEREGEANLYITCDGVRLAILTFTVMQDQKEQVLVIGGMQGAHRDTPHSLIRDATRACHGLFPKRLLIEQLMIFAAENHIGKIYGVSDEGHVFRSLRYRMRKRRVFHASYNEFWASLNAQPQSKSLNLLPQSIERKPLEEIASKKRAEARRRYALLDALSASFPR
ncbi:VirK/YbjX family protein [Erwinia sp. 9145]|uniref:VirK/YbjX family protein n=1 Tax=Erwinia sp. 9145 TaxID=1500895 RepID=UPI000551A86F|nr:VirK/YbjX family protein [Erwinia sp. 9145]